MRLNRLFYHTGKSPMISPYSRKTSSDLWHTLFKLLLIYAFNHNYELSPYVSDLNLKIECG